MSRDGLQGHLGCRLFGEAVSVPKQKSKVNVILVPSLSLLPFGPVFPAQGWGVGPPWAGLGQVGDAGPTLGCNTELEKWNDCGQDRQYSGIEIFKQLTGDEQIMNRSQHFF